MELISCEFVLVEVFVLFMEILVARLCFFDNGFKPSLVICDFLDLLHEYNQFKTKSFLFIFNLEIVLVGFVVIELSLT